MRSARAQRPLAAFGSDPARAAVLSHRWMSEMLRHQGYTHWPQHKEAIRAISLNAFPRIREEPIQAKLTDLIGVIAAHFELQRSWTSHQLAQQEHCAEVGAAYR